MQPCPFSITSIHRNVYKNFANKKAHENDRKTIKKWLFSVLLRHGFGGQFDRTLSHARSAFTENIESTYIADSIVSFPADKISKEINRYMTPVDNDFVNELLEKQKDDKYCFTILAMLYPHLDYKNNNFHKDHLHPAASYNMLSDELKNKYQWFMYNSVVNLQMLDANENESKGNMPLKDWVDKELQNTNNQKQFYDAHIIPNVDLSLENFDEFYRKRKELLAKKLKEFL